MNPLPPPTPWSLLLCLAIACGPEPTATPPQVAPPAAPPQAAPPQATEAAPPPEVQAVFGRMVSALGAGDPAAVGAHFLDRAEFLALSDCDPPTVVEEVMRGREQAMARAAQGPQPIGAWSLRGGTLVAVAAGEKPERCRALADVRLYKAHWTWQVDGRPESGEVHLLEVGATWRFARL